MKFIRLAFQASLFCNAVFNIGYSQGTWTWMKGDSTYNSFGNFGRQGIASLTNEPPARYACGYWTDTAGNFWIYGGATNETNDLWKFDPQTLMWTWMQGSTIAQAVRTINAGRGIYDSLNSPGYLIFGMFTWATPDNHLWLFGGQTDTIFQLGNNLWQYDPAINQWAWMGYFGPPNYGIKGIGDSTTMPGGRYEGNCAWTDSIGNLWLFGGFDTSDLSHNDMWKYNISTGIWTWMSGSSNPDDSGSYGIIGQPSVNNYPSARVTNLFWKDAQGNFWPVGGTQYSLENEIMFQDIWKFNPKTLEWTWVKGLEGIDTVTIGSDCSLDTLDKDGPRYENRTVWKFSNDLIITYNGFPNWNIDVGANDLWAYIVSDNGWVKINEWLYEGSYGIQGVADPSNYPTSRFGSVGFKDKENNLWMFGGQNGINYHNDLWKYVPDTACIYATTAGVQQVQEEEQVQLYPNPSASNWQLLVSNQLLGSPLAVYDMQGRLVYQSVIGQIKSEIPATGLAAGVYFLSIASPGGNVVRKLVKAP